MDEANVVLWSVQVLLALFFFAGGAPKVFGKGFDNWVGFSDLPRPLVILIGSAEVLGAVGLVLPMSTGVMPWLTPLSAVGLAVTVLMASGFHIRGAEGLIAVGTALWAGIAASIAIGRWDLVASGPRVPAWVLVAALGVMFPAAIVNVVVLWRRSIESSRRGQLLGVSTSGT